jgi:hypothetical protein
MTLQLTKTNSPGIPSSGGITSDGAGEAAMEEGLLEGMDSGESGESYIMLEEKHHNQCTAEFSRDDESEDTERGRTKIPELFEDVRDTKLRA